MYMGPRPNAPPASRHVCPKSFKFPQHLFVQNLALPYFLALVDAFCSLSQAYHFFFGFNSLYAEELQFVFHAYWLRLRRRFKRLQKEIGKLDGYILQSGPKIAEK